MKLAIVIPAYNEQESLGHVLNSLPKKINGIDEIKTIVVDDGSKDRTYEIAKWNKAIVVKHIVNQGLGAALSTGFAAARKIDADITITLDSDGQHNPIDIEKVITPVAQKKAEVVIGTRMLETKNMPILKIFGNWIMNMITYCVFQKWTTDSQSGMRAFSKEALKKLRIVSTGYEVSSEIIGEVKRNKLKMKEIQIDTIYTDYSNARGQFFVNGINILTRLITIRLSIKNDLHS